MPKKAKLSLNKSLLDKRTRKKVLGGTALFSAVAGIFGTAAYFIGQEAEQANNYAVQEGIRAEIIASGKKTIDGLDFSIKDYYQVQHEHGNHVYTFDFHTQIVTINGPDSSDLVMPFSEFPSPEMIEQARQAGVEISREFEQRLDTNLSEAEKAWLQTEGQRQNTANSWIRYQRQLSDWFLERNDRSNQTASEPPRP